MGIATDSTPLESPKNPDACTVFSLYKQIASPNEVKEMHRHYVSGGYGYGHAKQALFEALLSKFGTARQLFNDYMADTAHMEQILQQGANRAQETADPVLQRVRTRLGF